MGYNFYDIGNKITMERNERGWSQDKLIEKLSEKDVKIGRNTLSSIENGLQKSENFSLKLLTALSELFECEVGYLLCEYDCKTGRNTDIKKETGLSDTAINTLKEMPQQDLLVTNTLIARGDIILLRYALQNYYRKTFKSITISGLGEQSSIETEESNKIFQYLSNEFLHDIFNGIVHDKEITNFFMRKATTEYYKAFESAMEQNNTIYEQTPERIEFMKKSKEFIRKEIKKNENTDYYEEFTKRKA